jgi:hypothetical protein
VILSLKWFTSLMWSAVWWRTWNVCKDYLLHKHWQEGLLPYNYDIYWYSFLLCLYFNMSTYYRSLRQIWNCSLSLYVERLVILYFKPLFPSVQFAYAKCHRNDNSSSTVFIGSLQFTATGLSAEVAWWLPSFYSHRLCGVCNG